jgi:hypothetical protein
MKKNSAVILSSLILLFVTGQSLFPQTTSEPMKLGLVGVGLHGEQYKISEALSNYYSAYTSTVLIPINLKQHFRLEPEVGMLWFNSKSDNQKSYGTSTGLGAFYMFQRGKVNFYTGLRFMFDQGKVKNYSSTDGESSTDKFTDIKVGPALGFEYFLVNNFSVGGEIGLQYTSSKMADLKNQMFNFDSGLFMRVYF